RSGYRALDPIVILRVEDAKGNVLSSCGEDGNTACQFDRPQTQQVLSEQLAYLITNILSDEQARIGAFGHPNPLEIDRPAAAKTGTTNDFLDNWTMGYTPQLVVGVWVGNTDSKPMKNVSGLTGAAPIWNALMKYSVKQLGLPPEGWKEPQGIVKARVCYPSGLMPSRICQSAVNEVFISGTEPHSTDNVWQEFEINRETGKLATVFTPQNLVEKKVFQVLPPEASDWIRETGLPQPPNEYDTIQNPNDKADVAILSPSPFGYVRGEIVIKGTVKPENFQLFKLQFGPGLNPTKWTQIGDDRKEKIENDELGKWNTTGLNGLYTIQLVALKLDQTFAVSTMQVTVDNTPPNVKLLAPTDNQEFQIKDESIIIQPDAKDNLSLSFVEIYVDDKKVATNTVAPFTTRWKMTAGKHVIYVKAIDAAGNE
ncbi:MAG: Ig-like domain-containing protein, partial [Chloroflexota bacterium]